MAAVGLVKQVEIPAHVAEHQEIVSLVALVQKVGLYEIATAVLQGDHGRLLLGVVLHGEYGSAAAGQLIGVLRACRDLLHGDGGAHVTQGDVTNG